MTKFLAVAAPVLFAMSASSQQQPLTIGCSSPATGETQSCPANTRDGVLMLREQSVNLCQQGSTWSYDRHAITVSGGCAADFMISGRGSRGYKDGGPYGEHGYESRVSNTANTSLRDAGEPTQALPKRLPPALPEGTQIAMQLDNAIRVSSLTQGQMLTGILVKDLVVSGRTAASVGSAVQARVRSITAGQPDIRLVALHAGSATYPLQSTAVHGMHDVVEVDSSARNGFSAPRNSSIDPALIFPGSIFVFRLTSIALPAESQ